MPIYTGTGDEGHTGLFGNRRVPKDDVRICAYGTIDELNAALGLLRTELSEDSHPTVRQIATVQATLFEIGADLATEGGNACIPRAQPAIAELDTWIDESENALAPLKSFILPGGTKAACHLHLARTITRRAERNYWTLQREAADTHPVTILEGGVCI